MNQYSKFYDIVKFLTEQEGGVREPAGADGKVKVITTGISLGILPPDTDPKKSSFSAGKLGPFIDKGMMKYLSDGKTVVITGTPYKVGQLLKDPSWGYVLKTLKTVALAPGEQELLGDFTKLRATLPPVSREEFVNTFSHFQKDEVLGRNATLHYGKELHITHLVGSAVLDDEKENDLRHGDAVLGTPDLNAAMSHFKTSYFGEVNVERSPVGLVVRTNNCSENFSIKDSTTLVKYRPFTVLNIDGEQINLCTLLTNSAKVQLLLIKYKNKLVELLMEE